MYKHLHTKIKCLFELILSRSLILNTPNHPLASNHENLDPISFLINRTSPHLKTTLPIQHLLVSSLEQENVVIFGMKDLLCCLIQQTSFFCGFLKSSPPV